MLATTKKLSFKTTKALLLLIFLTCSCLIQANLAPSYFVFAKQLRTNSPLESLTSVIDNQPNSYHIGLKWILLEKNAYFVELPVLFYLPYIQKKESLRYLVEEERITGKKILEVQDKTRERFRISLINNIRILNNLYFKVGGVLQYDTIKYEHQCFRQDNKRDTYKDIGLIVGLHFLFPTIKSVDISLLGYLPILGKSTVFNAYQECVYDTSWSNILKNRKALSLHVNLKIF